MKNYVVLTILIFTIINCGGDIPKYRTKTVGEMVVPIEKSIVIGRFYGKPFFPFNFYIEKIVINYEDIIFGNKYAIESETMSRLSATSNFDSIRRDGWFVLELRPSTYMIWDISKYRVDTYSVAEIKRRIAVKFDVTQGSSFYYISSIMFDEAGRWLITNELDVAKNILNDMLPNYSGQIIYQPVMGENK